MADIIFVFGWAKRRRVDGLVGPSSGVL